MIMNDYSELKGEFGLRLVKCDVAREGGWLINAAVVIDGAREGRSREARRKRANILAI